jgi:peptidyl-prolyl cis-trans isomerase SurA
MNWLVDFMIKFARFVLCCLFVYCCNNVAIAIEALDKIVAIVNNDIITNAELIQNKKMILSRINLERTALPEDSILKRQILNQMIVDKLQLQLAVNAGIEVETQSLNTAIREIAKEEKMTLEEFQNKLKSKGISVEKFRKHLQEEMTIDRLRQREVGREIVVSSADIDGFLNSPVGQDQSGTEYRLQHILLSTPDSPTPQAIAKVKQQADDVLSELKSGADFAKMAMSKSAGQQALHGGDLGWRKIGEIPTLFVKYIPTMPLNGIIGPIQSSNGFHIVKLVDKRIGNIKPHLETHVRQILIKPSVNTSDEEAKRSLNKIRTQIIKGKDFATLAEHKSEELSTATNGGDLGWVTEKSVLPKFYKEMQALKNGELSKPFKTEMGWHLIQVLDRRSQTTSIAAARNKAREILRERKYQEMLEAWIKKIRDNAKIEILL